MNIVKKGDFVKVKVEYALKIPTRMHYGEVLETNNRIGDNEIRLKCDLRYNNNSTVWIENKFYETIK